MRRRFIHYLALLSLLFVGGPAWTAPWPIADLAVLVDPAGTETIESVSRAERAGEFITIPHGFSGGYTRKVHWLRFRLNPP